MDSSPKSTSASSPGLLIPFPWKQGEHLTILGRTGTGKTRLASALLRARRSVISLVTKADDSSRYLPNDSRRPIRHVRDISTSDPRRRYYVLEPRLQDQQAEALAAMRRVWADGGWTLYLDELFYLEKQLGLRQPIELLLTQGRSKGLTIVCGMQRPAWVSMFAVSEPTHVVCFPLAHPDDRKRVLQATSADLAEPLARLHRYEALWYYRTDNSYAIVSLDRLVPGQAPRPPAGKGDGQDASSLARQR